MAEMPPLTATVELKSTVVVRPGDILVLFVHPPSRLTTEERAKMRALAEEALPGVTVSVVEGIHQALVYRAGGEAA
jgi:hypothetical protein